MGTNVEAHEIIAAVAVCALPISEEYEWEPYSVAVVWQSGANYSIEYDGAYYAGTWDHYSRDRDGPWEEWLQAHQFPYFEALGLARLVCQTITVGGLSAADVLAKQQE